MQQTPFNYELIIHDDASTDSTADILRQYKERYKGKIHLIIENDNQFSKTGFNFIRDMFASRKRRIHCSLRGVTIIGRIH